MFRPIQPAFKIRIHHGGRDKRVQADQLRSAVGATNVGSNGDSLDIESCVAYPVTYEEQESLLNTLTFTVDKHAEILLYYFHLGQSVSLMGGFYSDETYSMRHVFSGTVTRIKTQFADNGHVSFSVECMNYGFTKLGKDMKNFVYPDPRSLRRFAKGASVSLEAIIRGIAEDNNFEIGEINLSSKTRQVEFSKINIEYQRNESDWKYLTNLAYKFGCNVWISSDENGTERLNFVEKSRAADKQGEIAFLYPLNGVIKDFTSAETQKFSNSAYNRPRILRNVTVDEDISAAYAVSRTAQYFDKDTGEYKEGLSRITTDKDGHNSITFYELDPNRVAWVRQNRPDLAQKIMYSSPASMKWGDDPNNPEFSSFYYKAVRIYDETTAVFDKAFFGIRVSAKCNQDLNIHSQRSYHIRGILSYHTQGTESTFFLQGLKHIWDTDGTWTELSFIR